MELADIHQRLADALPIRVPQFDPNESPRVKVEALENHLLRCAWHRAELEEALHWAIEAGKLLRRRWDGLQGWEAQLRAGRSTNEQVEAAKRTIDPELWDGMQEVRTLIESLRRQIVRLGGTDYDAVSRAYTLISGS